MLPLSPVIFLIWMAPILEKIEQRMKEEVGRVGQMRNEIDVELPSFVDDMLIDMVNWEGGALYCIVLYLQPVLNPKSYDGALVLEASGRPLLVKERR